MTDNEMPILTLTPNLDEPQTAPVAEKEAEPAPVMEFALLSPEEQTAVTAFSQQIDITNSQLVMQYGAGAQKNIADFSAAALDSVRTKDLGAIGDMITSLVVELKNFDSEEEAKGLRGLFKKSGKTLETLKTKYSKAEVSVDKISENLEGHQVVLLKDIAVLDQLYEKNLAYYKELSMYIIAGKKKLEEERSTTLVQLRQKAAESSLAEDAQRAKDYEDLCTRFEKKLHDLELTRVICIQMAPQIRMIQSSDTIMAEKIQTSVANTIPLWKSQMVLTLGMSHTQQALTAQQQVTEVTNQLLRKNAEMLKIATVETAKESERSVVDIETLKYTNQQLITTLDEVLTIQSEGAKKRSQAEVELRQIEGELKQKLLEVRR